MLLLRLSNCFFIAALLAGLQSDDLMLLRRLGRNCTQVHWQFNWSFPLASPISSLIRRRDELNRDWSFHERPVPFHLTHAAKMSWIGIDHYSTNVLFIPILHSHLANAARMSWIGTNHSINNLFNLILQMLQRWAESAMIESGAWGRDHD